MYFTVNLRYEIRHDLVFNLMISQVIAASAIGLVDCYKQRGYNPFIDNPFEVISQPDVFHPKRGVDPCVSVCGGFVEKYVEEETEANFSDLVSCVLVKFECDPEYEYLKHLPVLDYRKKRSDHPEDIALRVIQTFTKIGLILATFLG